MKIKNAAQLIMQALSRLQELFIDEAELTFIMRVPDEADAYMLITNDDLAELIALLQRCKNHDSRRTSPAP